MKKKSNLKKALLFSAFTTLLSVSVLAGTTYAWFTDNVVNEKNYIVSGNLDVELYAKFDGEYQAVTGETTLFNQNALWEPGHMEIVNLKVANVGSLALHYTLGVNIVHEDPGISVETNAPFNLSDYIMYAVVDGDESYATRDEALLAATRATPKKLSVVGYEESYELLPKVEEHPEYISEHCVTMIVYMPTDIGNEANHKTGTPAPNIELGVNLSAMQSSFESDHFDDKYDEGNCDHRVQIGNKLYTSFSAAMKSAKDGDTIKLLQDAEVKNFTYSAAAPTTIGIDLNEHTLSTTATSYLGNYKTGTALDFTIKNGTLNCTGTAIWPDAGTKLTLDNVELVANGNYGITMPSLKNNPLGNVEVIVKNSKVVGKGYTGIVNFGPYPVTIENSTIEGKYYGLTQNGQAAAAPATYNITGSTITATDVEGVGIYISNTLGADDKIHTFNLTDSTVIGATALEVKHTNATIVGCTLIANAPELTATENGNGSCTQGYSLAVTTNSASSHISGNVSVDETTTLIWKKGEVEEEGKVFVFNPDGTATSVIVKGTAISEAMTYYTPATPAA